MRCHVWHVRIKPLNCGLHNTRQISISFDVVVWCKWNRWAVEFVSNRRLNQLQTVTDNHWPPWYCGEFIPVGAQKLKAMTLLSWVIYLSNILSFARRAGSPKNRLGSGPRRDTDQWPFSPSTGGLGLTLIVWMLTLVFHVGEEKSWLRPLFRGQHPDYDGTT